MKADTYIEFQKINARIDALTKAVNALVSEGSDRKAARALKIDVEGSTRKLREAMLAAPAKTRRKS